MASVSCWLQQTGNKLNLPSACICVFLGSSTINNPVNMMPFWGNKGQRSKCIYIFFLNEMGLRMSSCILPCFWTFLRGGLRQAIPKSFLIFRKKFHFLVYTHAHIPWWCHPIEEQVSISMWHIPLLSRHIYHLRMYICWLRSGIYANSGVVYFWTSEVYARK